MTSPSTHAREAACLASVVLPRTKTSSPRAWRGKELHRFLALAAEKGREVALMSVEEEFREAARAIDFAKLPKMDQRTGRPEVRISWHSGTGAVHDHTTVPDLARALKAHDPAWVVMVLDWVGVTDTAVVILDWKFGFSHVDRADVNLQLADYAVGACALFDKEEAVVGIGRVLDNGEPWFDVVRLDAMQVEAAGARLRAHLRKVEAARKAFSDSGVVPRAVEGDHCRWCESYAHCPAKKELAISVIAMGDIEREAEPLTVESAAALWPKLVEAEKLVARLKGNVRDFARQQRVPLANGNVLALVKKTERNLEPDLTADYVAGHLVDREGVPVPISDVVKVKKTATLAALEAAVKLGCDPKKREFAGRMRDVEADMQKTGAMRVFTWDTVDEVAPDSPKLVATPAPTLEEQLQQSLEAGKAANE